VKEQTKTHSEQDIRIFGRPRSAGIPEYTDRISEITEAASHLSASSFEIVGEAVVFDEKGRTWFEGSQRRCSTQNQAKQAVLKAKYPVVMLAFDITELEGRDLKNLPWEKRKEILEGLLLDSRRDQVDIQYLPHTDDRRGLFNEMVEKGEEGVILKRYGSPYVRTRSRDWLKVKKWYNERCLVVGYTEGTGKRANLFGSLILAQPDDGGVLQYRGKVGSGFNDAEIRHIYKQLEKHEADNEPFDTGEDYTPVDIELEVTVKFFESTKNGIFRFPSMLKDEQGNNLIHYGDRTISGRKQLGLKDLLSGVKA